MNVTKRDNTIESLNPSKIRKHLEYACEGLSGTIASEVEINALIQFEDCIPTSHIQDILVQSALGLIDSNPNYSIVAGRLYLQTLRRTVYGKGWIPPTIRDHLENNLENNIYTNSLLLYTREEFQLLESVIDHNLEEYMSYASIKTYTDKYLISNNDNKIFETPQMANMLRFMTAFVNTKDRVNKIVSIYKKYNESKFSLPSPTMKAMRTNSKQYNSCAVVKLEDSLDSFDAINGVILALSSKMYGLGLDGGKIRRLGAPVRNGEIEHTGSTKFIQMFEKTLNSCSQGGMRKGSLTYYYPIWHYDVQDLIMLRDHGGMDENRCRTLMYAVQNHGLFWKLFLEGKDITLFSPEDVPDLYEAFFNDSVEFEKLYFQYSKDESIKTKTISSTELFSLIATQMYQTGKVFLANVDLMNEQTPFNDTIYSSNLCMEISLPTKPIIKGKNDPEGLISLCTLAAVNWQAHSSPNDLEDTMKLLVEFMNEGLHDQPSYLKPAENSTKWFAPLGIGVTNLAHFMADKGLKYGNSKDNSIIHEWMEATYYYALKGSMLYAKNNPDRIPSKIDTISHANGEYVFENYKGMNNYPEICDDWSLKQDWDLLTHYIKKYRLANSTLLAMMPGETSSIIQNLTNSLEPISFNKSSKSGNLKYFPPNYKELSNKYQRIFEVSNEDYLKTAAIIQRFNCQAISLNLYFARDKNDKQEVSDIISSMLYSYTLGLKTIYYTKNKGNDDSYYDITEEDCESCKL